MQQNFFAYTAAGLAPAYVSLNEHDDGTVVLTARGSGDGAKTVEVVLPLEQLAELYRGAYRLASKQSPRPKGL